jgi:hypothetical protein
MKTLIVAPAAARIFAKTALLSGVLMAFAPGIVQPMRIRGLRPT